MCVRQPCLLLPQPCSAAAGCSHGLELRCAGEHRSNEAAGLAVPRGDDHTIRTLAIGPRQPQIAKPAAALVVLIRVTGVLSKQLAALAAGPAAGRAAGKARLEAGPSGGGCWHRRQEGRQGSTHWTGATSRIPQCETAVRAQGEGAGRGGRQRGRGRRFTPAREHGEHGQRAERSPRHNAIRIHYIDAQHSVLAACPHGECQQLRKRREGGRCQRGGQGGRAAACMSSA